MDDPARDDESVPALLEELVEPLAEPETCRAYPAGTMLRAADGTAFQLIDQLSGTPRVRIYESVATTGDTVWLHEALTEDGTAELIRRVQILDGLECPMFPRVVATFKWEGKTYLAEDPVTGPSLIEEMAAARLTLLSALRILSQVAYALARLHARGWTCLGLRPSAVRLGKPLKIVDLAYATRFGEVPAGRYYHAGYSPPELLKGEPVDARADVYAVGALLFHIVNGRPIAETGMELLAWEPPTPVAGVPQILHRCLGDRESRYASMEELHRDLLRLTRRITPELRHAVAGASSIGLEPTRTTNQDAFGHLSGRVATEAADRAWSVVCVADGMGGMEAGDTASAAAVDAVLAQAADALAHRRSFTAEEQVQEVRRWAQVANENVCAALEGQRAKGGCTLICGFVVGKRMTIAHVGDCRAYLVRGEEIRPLTRDHSLPMALVQQGELAIEAVRTHPDRSKVLRSLGDRRPMPDYFIDSLEPAVGSTTLELQSGDTLLMCSDGVWEPLDEEAMLRLLRDHPASLPAAADALVAATLSRGAPDNATVVLLRAEEGLAREEL